jgi:hypothetical protein
VVYDKMKCYELTILSSALWTKILMVQKVMSAGGVLAIWMPEE